MATSTKFLWPMPKVSAPKGRAADNPEKRPRGAVDPHAYDKPVYVPFEQRIKKST